MCWGTTTGLTFAGTCERTQSSDGSIIITELSDNYWTGASFAIPSGKQFDVTGFTIDLAGQAYTWGYKVELVNGDGTVEYTTSGTTVKMGTNAVQIAASNLEVSLKNTAYIKVYYCLSGTSSNSKYFAIPEMHLTGTLNDAAAQTQYTKPSITEGDYDQATGTYSVTLSVQNDEDGTINYTIGDNAQVTGVESGTTVSVPYNTTITATVSGNSYDESIEESLTTSDMPALAAPTYSITGYDFATSKYTVELSAAAGTISYTVNGGAATEYTAPFQADANATIVVCAAQENMKNSSNLTFKTAAAPADGTHSTTSFTDYTDGMIYNAGAYTINNAVAYIGGKISGSTTPMNNSIKMRISRNIAAEGYGDNLGFHLDVNPGYYITSVKMRICNNYETNINLAGVFADDNTTDNLLSAPVAISKPASASDTPATVEISGIAAQKYVVFTFVSAEGETSTPNQAQVELTVEYKVPAVAMVNETVGYGTMYYDKELLIPEGTTAYTGQLSGNTLTLTELTEGIIPANEAVIISGTGGIFHPSFTGAAKSAGNDLQGTLEDIATSSVSGGTVCVLGYADDKAGFYRFDGETLAANKAYLVVPEQAAGSRISIVLGDQTSAGVVELDDNQAADAPLYNLSGMRVGSNAKGIVIANGKKYVK